MHDQLLTVLEVARILHFSRAYIYLLISRGDIIAVKFGHALRVHPQDLDAHVQQRRLAAQAKISRRRIARERTSIEETTSHERPRPPTTKAA